MPQNMLLPPSPCDVRRVHLGFSEYSQVLSWSRRLWSLATQDDSWELEINSLGSNPYIFRVNLVQPGTCEMLRCSENCFLKWVEQWTCHWISARFHWHFPPSSQDGSNWLQMTQGREGVSKWVIVNALLCKEDGTELLAHIKNKKCQNCSLMFTRTLRARKSRFCVCVANSNLLILELNYLCYKQFKFFH